MSSLHIAALSLIFLGGWSSAAPTSGLAPTRLAAPTPGLAPARWAAWDRPSGLSKLEFQSLLQRFVNEQYLKSFRKLGEENDFDHGHLLFDAKSPRRPIAILYHTQELTQDAGMDPRARNWIQWTDRGTIENADRYERKKYPHSAAWDWFLQRELAALRQHHTILDKMLDPDLLGADILESRQWVFTRVGCGSAPPAPDSNLIKVLLPPGPSVCMTLSQS